MARRSFSSNLRVEALEDRNYPSTLAPSAGILSDRPSFERQHIVPYYLKVQSIDGESADSVPAGRTQEGTASVNVGVPLVDVDGAAPSRTNTNFFHGRFLTADDLTREQAAVEGGRGNDVISGGAGNDRIGQSSVNKYEWLVHIDRPVLDAGIDGEGDESVLLLAESRFGEVNGDGRPDVATNSYTSDTVSVLLGNGGGTLG